MLSDKPWLKDIERTPPPLQTRLGTWRLDKNEFLIGWHQDLYKQFLERLTPDHLSTHPELGRLYALISTYIGAPVDHLLVGAGTDLCIHAAFDAFVSPGDCVVVPSPTFLMYEIYGKASGAHVRNVNYDSNLTLSVDNICAAIRDDVALVCLPNPGSPIGSVLSVDDIEKIVVRAAEYNVPVLVDEAYYPFYPESCVELVKRYGNLIVTRTFSKAAGLAGARIGFAVGSPMLMSRLRAFKPMYEITFPSVLLAEIVLENIDHMYAYAEDVRNGRNLLEKYFQSLGYRTFGGEANFLLVDFGKNRDSVISALNAAGVLYKSSFAHPALAGWSRLSVGPQQYIESFIDQFSGWMKKG